MDVRGDILRISPRSSRLLLDGSGITPLIPSLVLGPTTAGSEKSLFCITVRSSHVLDLYPGMISPDLHRRMQSIRSLLQECEETLLGYERMPPRRLLVETGWSADRPCDYCGDCGGDVANHGSNCSRIDVRGVSHVIRLGAYREPLSAWIREIKFARWACMARHLGSLLGRACVDSIEHGRHVPEFVVPVPMPLLRRRARGIDHARLLAREVAAQTGLPLRNLLRQRHGPTQVSTRNGGRRRRSNPFLASSRGKLTKGKNILLVDDVLTTGSTCRDACRVLRSMGSGTISLAILAVTDDR